MLKKENLYDLVLYESCNSWFVKRTAGLFGDRWLAFISKKLMDKTIKKFKNYEKYSNKNNTLNDES